MSVFNDVKEYNATGVGSTNLIVDLAGTEPLELVSASAQDGPAGSGIAAVEVTYIDSATSLITTKTVALNGATPVAAGFTAKAILWMESRTVAASNIVDVSAILILLTE